MLSAVRLNLLVYQAHEGRFARAVTAHQADALARVDLQGRAV